MARCSYCGRETELYEGGTPTCIPCSERLLTPKRSIHSSLIRELLEAAAEHDSATTAYNEVMWEIPSAIPHPDGVRGIHSVSHKVQVAKDRLARAHTRLRDFLDRGSLPEDLK